MCLEREREREKEPFFSHSFCNNEGKKRRGDLTWWWCIKKSPPVTRASPICRTSFRRSRRGVEIQEELLLLVSHKCASIGIYTNIMENRERGSLFFFQVRPRYHTRRRFRFNWPACMQHRSSLIQINVSCWKPLRQRLQQLSPLI